MSADSTGDDAPFGHPTMELYASGDPRGAEVAVVVTLYDYERFITATLDSVLAQDFAECHLLIVDDRGSSAACATAREWLAQHGAALTSARLLQHDRNHGVSAARNTAVANCTAPYVFMLDSDNVLYPTCLVRCLQALRTSGAAFAYPMLEMFGEEEGVISFGSWDRERLAHGNYIDTLALIRREAWLAVGGATTMQVSGWNDYELWCKFAEHGFWGVHVPQVLARYRVHLGSHLHSLIDRPDNAERIKAEMQRRHPWLKS